MNVEPTKRLSISIPESIADRLTVVADHVGCSRSAVCAHLLDFGTTDLLSVCDRDTRLETVSGVIRRPTGRTVDELDAIFEYLQERLKQRDLAQWLSGDYVLEQEQDGDA